MRIGILSDTHNQRQRTLSAVHMLRNEGAEVLIHCGDLVEPEMISTCSSLPCYIVFGNNDSGRVSEIRTTIFQTEGAVCLEWGGEILLADKRIAVTHGHSTSEVKRLLAAGPDFLLSGHSHIAGVCREGVTTRINPGALHRASSFSVALLNLADDDLRFLNVPR